MDIDIDKIVIDTIEWSAPEYEHKQHSNDWFWAIGIIALAALILAIWFKNYVFAIFILLSGVSLFMFSVRNPKDIQFIIEKKGVGMGRDFFPWKDLKSFNINNDDNNDYAKLFLETKKHFLPIYTLPLPKEKIEQVKESLLKMIPSSEVRESQTMSIAEKLGF